VYVNHSEFHRNRSCRSPVATCARKDVREITSNWTSFHNSLFSVPYRHDSLLGRKSIRCNCMQVCMPPCDSASRSTSNGNPCHLRTIRHILIKKVRVRISARRQVIVTELFLAFLSLSQQASTSIVLVRSHSSSLYSAECFLWGRSWMFKYRSDELRSWAVTSHLNFSVRKKVRKSILYLLTS
jgi:hypothetical protein